MTAARAFCKDRDATLRSLDRDRLDRFLRKWNQPRPREWIGDSWLAAMHKARLQIDAFTEAEKAVSPRMAIQRRSAMPAFVRAAVAQARQIQIAPCVG
jgi:hypothetical protein